MGKLRGCKLICFGNKARENVGENIEGCIRSQHAYWVEEFLYGFKTEDFQIIKLVIKQLAWDLAFGCLNEFLNFKLNFNISEALLDKS